VVRVKLGDFGLALNMNPSVTHMTLPGHVGTPLTTAPEIFTERKTSANSDVFAWGMIMAACAMAAAPPIIIYTFLMDYYIAGLTAGATKG